MKNQNRDSTTSDDDYNLSAEKEKRLRSGMRKFLHAMNAAHGTNFPVDDLHDNDDDDHQKKNTRPSKKIKCRIVINQQNPLFAENPDKETTTAAGGGDDLAVLFMEKCLTDTDTRDYFHRLLIPLTKVKNYGFFTREELEKLKKMEPIEATLIDPCERKYEIKLKMERVGPSCDCYKIPKPWNEIKHNNGLREGMWVRLWTSRCRNGSKLRFNLILPEKGNIYNMNGN